MRAPGHDSPGRAAPFVSVIVPVFDDASGIRRALDALLQQSYPPDRYEVVVADNGSTDATRDVVSRYVARCPERVRLVLESDVQSSYAARNRAIEVVVGEILAFTDSDCVPDRDWLERGVTGLAEADAAYAAGRVAMTFRGHHPSLWEYYDAVGKLNQDRYMERYGFGATANLFVRRESIDAHGGFRPDLVSGGDYEFGRRLSRAGERGVYVDDALVRHPARSSGAAVLKKERRILRGRRQLEALGLLDHGRLGWRSFLPVRSVPPLDGHRPGLLRRVALLALINAVRYYTVVLRIAALRSAR